LLVLTSGMVFAQYWRRRSAPPNLTDPRYRNGVPMWNLEEDFKHDIFTFVRIDYTSMSDHRGWDKWRTDWPNSDLNFSYRIQELTALQSHPEGIILRLTDDELFNYPFIYVIEPGHMSLTDPEIEALRRYLLNGGFMMVDDFWGEQEWDVFYYNIKQVFPDREPVELPLEHEIFHCVYDLKEMPMVPSVHHALGGHRTERYDAMQAHYRALFDDNDRMMAIICHNTDLGDGWEREGVSQWYFKEFSEKWAYPMGINIVVYAMTH
jgi:hypothetical protein